jgi:hypothetical protein
MFKRIATVLIAVVSVLSVSPLHAEGLLRLQPPAAPGQPQPQEGMTTKEVLTDVAIAALVIAGSIAIYKSTGRPCACPEDRMSNGRACGGNSAYKRPGGARPLCYVTDITTSMIAAYRASKVSIRPRPRLSAPDQAAALATAARAAFQFHGSKSSRRCIG